MVLIHNGILLSHKKNEIMPLAATWMDLEIIILNEISETEKDKYDITYVWNLKKKKMRQMNLFTKQKQTQREQTYNYKRGNMVERDKSGIWD